MYIYVALFRKKENNGGSVDGLDKNHGSVTCIREVGRFPEDQVIKMLKAAVSNFPGVWRIYRTINKRDFERAYKELGCLMFKGEVEVTKVDTKWKSILMSPKNKKGRGLWLLDIDDMSKLTDVINYLDEYNVEVLDNYSTPNGCGIIVEPFDNREFKFDDVSIKKDALKFLERIEVE